MNLYTLVNIFKTVSLTNKFVEEWNDGDIYEHLNSGTHKYGCANLTLANISMDRDLMSVTGTLFWADRLMDGGSNTLEVRSNGVAILNNILLNIQENYPELNFTSIQYQLFTEQFGDLCAGAYCSFTLTLPVDSACANDSFEQKTLSITENGLYDVIGYTQVCVAVATSWGDISGDIDDQEDLKEALDAKASNTDLNAAKARITTAETNITSLQTQMSGKASKSDLKKLKPLIFAGL